MNHRRAIVDLICSTTGSWQVSEKVHLLWTLATETGLMVLGTRVPQTPTVGPTRLNSLTSLRFFAALLVVVQHSLVDLAGLGRYPSINNLGSAGLSFFFMLSGFVLTWSDSTRDGTAAFYRNRFARVYPLHVITWVVAVAYSLLGLLGRGSGSRDLLALFLLQGWPDDFNPGLSRVS